MKGKIFTDREGRIIFMRNFSLNIPENIERQIVWMSQHMKHDDVFFVVPLILLVVVVILRGNAIWRKIHSFL